MIKNKKSQLLGFVMIVVLLVIIASILVYASITLRTQMYIGGRQNTAFQAYTAGETARDYVRNSAKFSGMYALRSLDLSNKIVCQNGYVIEATSANDFKDFFYTYFYAYTSLYPPEFPDFSVILPEYDEELILYKFEYNLVGDQINSIIVYSTNEKMNEDPILVFVENPLMIYTVSAAFKQEITCTEYNTYKKVI